MAEKRKYDVEGMTCGSCEALIGKVLYKTDGVDSVKADARNSTVEVEFDPAKVSEEGLKLKLKEAGYPVCERGAGGRDNTLLLLGAVVILVGFYLVLEYALRISGASFSLPKVDASTSFLLLFGVGLVTGLHCIAMCGGFVLSYSTKQKKNEIMPHLSYGAGKLMSYTAIGAFFGLVGSAIAFTVEMRIAVALLAGAFLVIYGLGMANVLPRFLASRLKMPGPLSNFRDSLSSKGPLATGLATGLFIACGPLQAMYILAMGSGSPVFGGLALFFFGLGTLPVMLGFSYVSSMISQAMANRITRYSGVLIVLLGLAMVNNAITLSGFQAVPSFGGANVASGTQGTLLLAGLSLNGSGNDTFQTIRMNVTSAGFEPSSFVLKKGVPVKWVINGVELNGCNSEIVVRQYGLDIKVKQGEQTVDFTPTDAGTVSWSCWMGMIPGRFVVVEGDPSSPAAQQAVQTAASAPLKSGSGCGCGMKR